MNPFHVSLAGITIDRAMVETLAWTLLHFVWQGLVVAAALALLDVLLSRSRPSLRYLVACIALLVMFASPIATFVVTKNGAARVSPSTIGSPAANRGASVGMAGTTIAAAGRPGSPQGAANTSASLERWRETIGTALAGLRDRLNASSALPWLVGFWALGVTLLSLRLLGGWWLVMRLGRSLHNVPVESYEQALRRLVHRMEISRPVRLLRSGWVSVPTTIGWLRPVILLPASTLTGLAPAQIEAVIAHELAHIRRHDYVINLLQSMIETLLFYHPAVWWVSRRIRDERELCCDDLAVRASGDAVTYARALCELEQMRGEQVRLALAASGGSLVVRIARLLGASTGSHLHASWGIAWVLIASLVLVGGAAGGAVRVAPRAPLVAARAPHRGLAAPVVPATPACPTIVPTVPAAAAEPSTECSEAPAPSDVACEEPTAEEAIGPEDVIEATPEADLEALGPGTAQKGPMPPFSAEEWERLAQVGVSQKYVANLARAGYRDLTVDELSMLAQHGVSSEYALRMRRLLGDPSPEDLVKLADHGVSTKYASAMRRGLGNPTVEDLVRLASSGVSSEFVAGMRKLDLSDLTADDLIRLANSGVTLEWFSSLRWMGYSDISVDRAIELRNSGVTPDYAASLRTLNRHNLTLDELRTLQNNGVDVEYAATMLGLVRKDLTVDELIRLRQNGVTVNYVASLNALGHADVPSDQIIMLFQQGVDPEFISALAGAGYARLAPRDLVRLRQNGVDGEFVAQAREAGYGKPSIAELIRWRQTGIPTRPIP